VQYGPYYLYVAVQPTGPTDVPGQSPKWRLAYITDGTLGGLIDVDDSAWTAPAGNVLGTTAAGQWGPVGTDTIIGPLQAEIGDPHVVATHTDLVGYIGEIDERLTAIEHTQETVAAERHLSVDKYSGSFTRVAVVPPTGPWPAKVDFALATVAGPNGAVFPDLAAIPGGAAVWADFAGTLGRLNMADGTAVYGSALKEWIRRGTVATVRRDDSDPAHPNLVVDRIDQPADIGSSLTLGALQDVDAPADTPAGKVLGTTAVGQWGPVDPPAGGGGGGPEAWWTTQVQGFLTVSNQWSAAYPQWDASTDYPRNAIVGRAGMYYYAPEDPTTGVSPPAAPWLPVNLLRIVQTKGMANGFAGLDSHGKVPDSELTHPIWTGTQAAYDALPTKDPSTVYMIAG
jgi:hypothetical protein